MDEGLLALLHDDGEMSDDEFLVLHGAGHGRSLHNGLPYWKYERSHFEAM